MFRRGKPTPVRKGPDVTQLEDRILLSATPVAVVVDAALTPDLSVMTMPPAATADDAAQALASDVQAADGGSQYESTSAAATTSDSEQQVRHELVLIDGSYEHADQLIRELAAGQDSQRVIDAFVLDCDRDGIEQITEILAGYDNLDELHIVSRGTDTSVTLGSVEVSANRLSAYAGQINQWQDALATGASLQFHGSALDQSADGQLLLEAIRTLTGADVTAGPDAAAEAILAMDVGDSASSTRSEIVFIDASVAEAEQLRNQLSEQADSERRLAVFLLSSDRDGVTQIQEVLSNHSDVAAIHLISHARDGEVKLGGTWLSQANLDGYADAIGQWRAALSADADLLFYGCDFAAGEAGQSILTRLATLTGADVAASTDTTGHQELGGDWQLEYQRGDIETTVALGVEMQTQWYGVLQPTTTGRVVFGDAGTTTAPKTNAWDGLELGSTASNTAAVGLWRVIQGAEAPQRDEAIVVGVTSTGAVKGELWNGTTWAALPTGTFGTQLGTVSESYWWGFDVAYEQQSGDAVLVWNDNSQTAGNKLRYSVWNGTSWTSPASITAFTGGEPQQMQLVAKPGGDEMVLVVNDVNADDYVLVWNGSSWGNAISLDTSGTLEDDQTAVQVAYETNTGQALVMYGKDADANVYYRVWNGSSWSGEASVAPPGGVTAQVQWLTVASDPTANRIALGAQTTDSKIWFAVWDGSNWSSQVLATSTLHTATAPAMALAFESNSGDLLAAFAQGDNKVYYKTWTSGGGWSANTTGPDIGTKPTTITLDRDPNTNAIMMMALGSNKDLSYSLWNGSSFGTDALVSSNTNESKNQPFVYLWNQQAGIAPPPTLWVSPSGDSATPGWSGVGAITDDQLLSFGGSSLALEPVSGTTSGSFSHVFQLDPFTGDGASDLDAVHYVSKMVTVGSGANSVTLQAGDILFSTLDDETLTSNNSVSVLDDEVILFRPDTVGDFSSGTFTILLDNFGSIHGGSDTWSLALVERDTAFGEITLTAGTFLFSRDGGAADSDIRRFIATGVGEATTSGSVDVLITGSHLDIDNKVYGLELVSQGFTVGGVALPTGALLLTISADESDGVGTNLLSIKKEDIVYLTVTQTSLAGTAQATATMLFDGSDVGVVGEVLDAVAIYHPNRAPVLDTTGSPTLTSIAEDSANPSGNTVAAILATGAGGDPISDADNDPDGIAVTGVENTNGSWQYSTDGGSSWFNLGGVSDGSARLLNAAAKIRFVPSSNYYGTATVSFRAWDQATGSNGGTADTTTNNWTTAFSLATETAVITVTPVNDAPSATAPASYNAMEQTSLTLHGTGLSVADIDAGTNSVQATLAVGTGTLTVSAGSTGVSVSGSGSSTVTLTGTLTQINNLLSGSLSAAATYFINSDTPPSSTNLVLTINDQGNYGSGGSLSDTKTSTINIAAVNDAPTATGPGTYNATEQTTLSLHGTGLTVGDVDAASSQVQSTMTVTSGTLTINAGTTGVTVGGSGTSSVTLTGTVAQISNLLAGNLSGTVRYLNSSDTPTSSATLVLSIDDQGNTGSGGALNASTTATINIAAVNDAPVASAPASFNASEQVNLTLHGAGMSISDVDAASSPVQATLTAGSGTLTVAAGTTGVAVSGSGSSAVTLTGSVAQINDLLSGNLGATATYLINLDTPPSSTTVVLTVNDQGNTGSGGSLVGSATSTINITAINDAPVNTVPGAQTTSKNNALSFSTTNGNSIAISDVDAASSSVQVTLTATNGTMTLSQTAGLSFTTGDGTTDGTMVFTGTVTSINAALQGMSFQPTSGYTGAASIQIQTDDQGNTGSGGALTDTDVVSITVVTPASGTAIWRASGDSTPNVADWQGSGFGSTTDSADVGSWRVMDGAEAPTRDEKTVLGVDGSGNITGQMWNGTSWSALSFNALDTIGVTDRHGFDVAYESLSGDAMVVWNNGSTGTTGLSYRVWNGTSWTSEQTITAPISGQPTQLYLAANPLNDQMTLLVCNADSDDYALVWNGSSWGNAVTLGTVTGGDNRDSHVAYEQQSGTAMVVYDSAGGTDLYYRTWDGASWSSESTLTAASSTSGDPSAVTLASDPTSDRIAVAVVTSSNEVWFKVWSGSSWSNESLASTTSISATEQVAVVAFEGQSGDLLAAYAESTNTVRYRTWTSGGGWSSEFSGPNIGSGETPNIMTLEADPTANTIMLAVQDSSNDISYSAWSGSAWGSVYQLESNSGETATQPFLFLFTQGTSPEANDDSVTTQLNTAININVVDNDTDPQGDSVTVLDVTNPTNGTVSVSGGTITYTPNGGFTGNDSFNYLASDSTEGIVHYWKLDGNGTDSVGSSNGTLTNGPATVAGRYGNALTFDEANDYVLISDYSYSNSFSVSFWFKLDDNSGTGQQFVYSHGSLGTQNSLNISFGEASFATTADRNKLITNFSDSNDATGNQVLDFDISGLVGDGQWHLYTLSVVSGSGSKTYLDGVLQASSSRGGDSFNPTGSVYLGARNDLNSARFYGEELDSVAVYNRGLTAQNASELYTGASSVGTVSVKVNSPPAISNLAGDSLSYAEGDGSVVIEQGDNATLTDSDTAAFTGGTLTVSFTAGSDGAEDVLGIRHQGTGAGQIGVSGSDVTYGGTAIGTYAGGSAGSDLVITFNGNSSAAAATALVRNITFLDTDTDNPTTGARTVRFVMTDGEGGTSGSYDTTVTVSRVNDAPTANMPVGTYAATEQSSLTLQGTGMTIADVDALSSSVQATLSVGSGTLSASAGTTGVTIGGAGTGTLTLTGTITQINDLLAGNLSGTISYLDSSDNPPSSTTLVLQANDQGNTGSGGALTGSATSTITIAGVNDAPTATVPASYNATEQTSLTLHGTGLSIADADAASGSLQATVSVTYGTLTVGAGTTGVSVSGSGTSTITLTGTLTQINNLLAGDLGATATYLNSSDTPPTTDTLVLSINDQGNSGAGGAKSDAGTSTINLSAVNDAPVITVPGAQSIDEDNSLSFSTASANLISIADADAASGTLFVTLTMSNGTLTLSTTAGLTFNSGANGTSAMEFTGSVSAINAALEGMYYTPNVDFNGGAALVVAVDDQGNIGSGGAQVDSKTVAVTVNAVNDAPLLDSTGTMTLSTITEDDVTNGGDSVAAIIASAGGNRITDVDAAAVEGIAITGLASGNGSWEYSTDAGANWYSVGSVSDANALLLRDVDRLRLVPNAQNATTASVAFRAWDQTSGTAGTKVNASTYGGTTAFSTASDTAAITVTAVNDAPVLGAIEGTALAYTENDTATAITASVIVTELDDGDSVVSATIQITGNYQSGADVLAFTDTGTITGSWNAGTGILTLSGSDTQANYEAALRSVTYHNTSDNPSGLTRAISFTVNDGTVNSNTVTRDITVTPVNDSPTVTSNGGGASASINLAENQTSVTTVASTDPDGGAAAYSIVGGADSTLFAINSSTGALTFLSAPNYESPTDAGADNVYDVVVQVADGNGGTDTQSLAITITDFDEFDVGSVTDSDATANSVAENAANGTTVGVTATASDADATTNAITYSLDDNAGGRFTIDSSTGVVTVVGAIDREGAASYDITVRATSSDTSFSTQVFTINVTDVDEFDVGSVTDSDATANSVAENAANGTTVGVTATASDADATTNTITYSLDDDAGGRFAIHSSTGVVTVAGAIDRESASSYNITVRATSADTSFSTQVFAINVTDVDEFDVGSVTDSDATANSVAENAANGTTVGITAAASDADATTNTITYSLDDDAGGRFTIHSSTGVVTVAGAIDREAAASYNITVRATSADTSFSTQAFTINLTDVDEFDVGSVTDSDATANAVAENAANGTTVGITAAASDADATTNTITYSLDDDAGGRFTIHSSTGVVTVAGAIDREAASSYNITVRATSADTSFSTQAFTINVTDVDEFDVGSVTDSDATANSVAENAANGTTVGITAAATDADATTNAITYSLDDSAGGRFAVHSSTGVVTVAGAIDREAASSYNITVRATSADTSFSTQAFTINITDVDEFDVGSVTDSDATANAVAENAVNGTTVRVTAAASDADATTNGITYSLDDNAGGRFAINSSTGVVTVAGAIDREAASSYDITVRATSADTSFSTQAFTINITDVDEFDVGSVTDSDATANSVAENAANGTTVGITAAASDADATTNAITYSLDDSAGGRFTIHSSTGVVTVAGAIDREAASSYDITVRATSADTSFSTQAFTINITDVDEFDVGSVTDSDATANSVAENAANGTTVGITAAASDADATTNTITYSLDDNAGGRFTIDSGTGVVTVAGAIDREAAASYNITVRATSADTSFSTQAFTINITDVDEFDVGSVTDSDATANSVAENAVNGTTVGITAAASDADATTNAITYSLDDDAGGRFAVHSSTGVVTVAGGIDRETASSYNITVRATSADTSFSTQAFTINITDVDEFDVGSVTDSDATANSVAENAVNGTTVGITAAASDADATTNAITYSLDDSAGGRFAIHSSTGVVTVAGAIDRETASSYNITVRATSADTSFSTQAFTINITDVDEFDVGSITDSDATANSVAENAVNGTTVGITSAASDADATTNAIIYSLDDSAGGRFTIHSSTGVVTVAGTIDREAASSYNITVRATSADTSFSTQAFTINITDVDEFDVGSVTDSDATANSVAENAANGTAVGITAAASDADATSNAITYSLDDNAGGRFTIHSSTGVVTVAGAIDRETASSYDITVRATSADTSFSTQVFTINITDVDEFDVGSVTDSDATANSVAENAANGTTVGVSAMASDADATTNAITYSLDDSAGGRFAIHSSTGVVTVAGAIDRETASSYNITVRATSADASFSTQVFSINVTDVDEFDVGSVTDGDATANSVAENAANGTTVGITAAASDADATTNTITYTLDDDAGGRFAVHSSTGVVTVAGAIDRETASSYNITVRATSADASYSTQVFTINVTDVDEFDVGSVTDSDATADSVAENAVNGTTVGITAAASDADATTNVITYSLDDDAGGRFTIHSGMGVVTVAGAIDREAASSYNITVRATSSDASFSTQVFTINITDVDEFDVGSVTDSDATANSVAENAVNGTTVGITAAASDADATTNTITYTLDDNAGGRFTIHSSTGVVTVAGAIDRESASSYNITVRATSADTSFSTQVFTVNITDVDEFDVGSVTDSDATANSVAENAVNGTTVGITAAASDADATTNTITYSLDDDAGGRFTIHSSTGVVTVAGSIDRETASSYDITVRATSADTSFSTQVFTINVTDVDEFDVGSVTDSDATANSVAENAVNGTTVGITAAASDADATTNAITYSLDDSAGGRFAINSSTGVVTVAGSIDREAASSYNITVRATSADTSFSTQVFTISITDVDEFDVGSVTDSDATANSVAENAVNGTTVGVTAAASDADATTNGITYSLDDNAGGRFAINSSTGVVTVAGSIDRETASSYDITVRATSADTSFSTQAFTINITDVDEFDVGSVTDSDATANSVAENAANGTTVGITAAASDADATSNAITYSLDDSAGGRFAIHSSTGVVTVAGAIDRETASSYDITVRATSTDTSFSTQVFTINITDVDEFDVGSVTDSDATANSVAENAANGTTVGITAAASDADATTNTITYSLDDSAGGRFAIHSSTGVVTVAGAIDREAASSYNITVRATSADTSFSTQVFTINITDVDEFDVGTVTDSDATANSVAENAANGTIVGITAAASDTDATTNAITYSLDDDAGGRFAIHSSTGVVTVAGGIDRETASSYNITVRATSADTSFSTQVFTVNITDVDEFDVGSVTDSDATANSVAENAVNGTTVGITAAASDADATTNAITYSLDDSAGGRFAINSSTGVVTVAGSIDRETASSYDITVRATSADASFSTQAFTINITDVDEFDVGSVTDSDATANSIAENAVNGTTVGITAAASDADATTYAITYSLDDSAGGRFAINSSTGVVTVAGAIDREAASSYDITVRATSADTSFSTQAFTINITDVDEFDVGSVTDSDATANSVAENAANGTTVGITAAASDADATTNTITYSLDDDAGGRFTIHSSTGVVTVAGAIDREAASSYDITVRTTSADTSFSTQVFTINITDVDEFDVGSVTDSDATANSVAENAVNGTTVGITAAASDADATATISYSLDDDAGGRFTINSTTGVVTVNAALDYESSNSHSVTVRATSSDGSFATQSFSIQVTDVNESGISAINDSDATANFVLENSSTGTGVGLTAFANDPDGTDTVSYSLDDDAGGQFSIHSTTGVVTVVGALDREAASSYAITVRATSSDTTTTTRNFTITLGDIDEYDVGTVSDSDATANSVAENAVNGTTVGITAAASDADATTNAITYSLDDNAGGRFAINNSTGVVTVAGSIDREAAASYDITVRATSADTSFSSQVFTINIVDVDEFDVGTVTDSDATANSVAESAANGTAVGITAAAIDADATTNAISYSLDDNAGGLFAIHSSTGVVTVAGAIDREAASSYNITVRATSADTSFSTQVFTINITDVDEFDVGAVTDSDATANSVAEDASVGTAVGLTGLASDADATATISYSLDDDAGGRLAINSTTGLVTVNAALDYESSTSHSVAVRATSNDGSFATQSFTIQVTDVNETGISIINDTDATANFVLENCGTGTGVGLTAFASDPDGTDAVSYSLDDDAGGRFAIHSSTGVVTVAGAIDRETASSYNIIVRATSADSSSATRSFQINVQGVNDNLPVIISNGGGVVALVTVQENTAAVTTVVAIDADAPSQSLTYSIGGGADAGRFTLNALTGQLAFLLAPSFEAPTDTGADNVYELQVLVSDGQGGTQTQTLFVSVADVNEAPQATGESFSTRSSDTLNVSGLLSNDSDPDGNSLTVVLAQGPAHGQLTLLPNGSFSYLPQTTFSGTDTFMYVVQDGSLNSNVVAVSIQVTGVAPLPPPPGSSNSSSSSSSSSHSNSSNSDTSSTAGTSSADASADSQVTEKSPSSAGTTSAAPLPAGLPPATESSREQGVRAREAHAEVAAQIAPTALVVNLSLVESGRLQSAAEQRYEHNSAYVQMLVSSQEPASVSTATTDRISQGIWDAMHQLENEVDQQPEMLTWTSGSVALAAITLTASYVLWTLKGGFLLASVVSTLPAWQFLDPLPILDETPVSGSRQGNTDADPDDFLF